MSVGSRPMVIAGAGCAGLSLAVRLVEAEESRQIIVFDPRSGYHSDRTWCFWRLEEHPFESCVEHQWARWTLQHRGRRVVCSSQRHPYQCIPASAFYDSALETLAAAPNVELHLETPVRAVSGSPSGVQVETSKGILDAALCFDSRPPEPTDGTLLQHFEGWEIRSAKPVFDPSTAVLMDFRQAPLAQTAPSQRAWPPEAGKEDIFFLYLLPFSPTRALIEATFFSLTPQPAEVYERALRTYLQEVLAVDSYELLRTERGVLPMGDLRPTVDQSTIPGTASRHLSLGSAAGCIRPSTGYGFLGIQRQCARISDLVTSQLGEPQALVPPAIWSPRARWMDRVFLDFLKRHPAEAGEAFLRLFERAPSSSVVRFLGDRQSLRDTWQVIRAMPSGRFAAAGIRTLLGTGKERADAA
ncbi:MAG: lycopene cyclase family protein [Acidobacteriota bacterium]